MSERLLARSRGRSLVSVGEKSEIFRKMAEKWPLLQAIAFLEVGFWPIFLCSRHVRLLKGSLFLALTGQKSGTLGNRVRVSGVRFGPVTCTFRPSAEILATPKSIADRQFGHF